MRDEIGTWTIRMVKSPAEVDLEFLQMTAKEELGRLFEFELEVRSRNPDLDIEDTAGENLTVELECDGATRRYFNGYVSRFTYAGTTALHSAYRVTLRPWLWFLTRTAGCRIFQDRTVPELVAEILAEHEFAEFEMMLEREYRRWDYLVQYRETTFDFLSRLLEQEGIYYYFRHQKDRHVLVLADNVVAHQQAPFYDYGPPSASGEDLRFSEWRVDQQPRPSSYVLTDFDFEDPRLDLEVRSGADSTSQGGDFEVFDYPGEYRTLSEGEAYVRERLEIHDAQREQVTCTSTVPGLAAGTLFRLTGHPRSDQNREYLVISAVHEVRWDPHLTAQSAAGESHKSRLVAIPSSVPFRPPLLTPKAVVKGPQTAIVVGPEGQKVWTDKYGRVKVRFHWDRRGKGDGNDSCWIRVSQGRAGSHWGAMQLPHVGQEVIVDFLEGDPDRPIITGNVYNAANMPPLELPKNQYRTVVARDHYGNEIVFDGTPGGEHIRIHSPHHNSRLVLGKSLEAHTASDDYKAAIGSSFETRLGSSVSVGVGSSLSASFGVKAELDLAPGVSVQGGHRRVFQLGTDETWSMRDRTQDCHEDYVLEVHGDSGKLSISADDYRKPEVKVVGGQIVRTAFAPPVKHRSMMYMDKGLLQLSFGKNVPQGEGDKGLSQTIGEGSLYVALGLVVLLEAARLGVHVKGEVDAWPDWAKATDATLSGVSGGISAIAALISFIVAMIPTKNRGAVKSEDEWTSIVELEQNSLVLDSKGEIDIGFSDATRIDVGNQRCDTYIDGRDVTIKAPGGILLEGEEVQLC